LSEEIAAAYGRVQRRIEDACARAGRSPAEVRLVAVSKTFGADRLRDLMACGHRVFGENRMQEALAKVTAVGPGATWHFVGHLQRNKARHAIGVFELIHSVDGIDIARELDRRAAARGLAQPILLEVNLAEEPTKSGLLERDLAATLDAIAGLKSLALRGLMAVPPAAGEPEQSRRWFARLRALRDQSEQRVGLRLPDLSMGMSGDFEVAIEEGATLVRVGQALFGAR
jgi:pyridoxal phosphate enzyme (YggS family)